MAPVQRRMAVEAVITGYLLNFFVIGKVLSKTLYMFSQRLYYLLKTLSMLFNKKSNKSLEILVKAILLHDKKIL